jgi:hypothetical protein
VVARRDQQSQAGLGARGRGHPIERATSGRIGLAYRTFRLLVLLRR